MIGWGPCVESWLGQKKDKEKVEILRRLLEKHIQQVSRSPHHLSSALSNLLVVPELQAG